MDSLADMVNAFRTNQQSPGIAQTSLLESCLAFRGPGGRQTPDAGDPMRYLACLCRLHFASTDMRSPISDSVMCSDASMYGGGTCASTGLPAMGIAALEEEVDGFRPYGASSSTKQVVPGIPEDFVQPRLWWSASLTVLAG